MSFHNSKISLLSDSNISVAHRSINQWRNQDFCINQGVEEVILATSKPKKRAGRRIFKETRHPIFRGVRRRNKNKWVCELREPNKKTRIWLGTYPTPEMAARAYDVAALAFRGRSVCLNFADSAWRLPIPTSRDVKDIIRAAAEAAKMFRPQEFEEIDNSQLRVLENNIEDSNSDLISDCNSDGNVEYAKNSQENLFSPQKFIFMDEEAMFNMPRLLVNLAEGLMLSPPSLTDEAKFDNIDVSLWSY